MSNFGGIKLKTFIKKIRRSCYLDNKEFFDSNKKKINLSVEDYDLSDTRLYKALNTETDKKVRHLTILCMIGREFSYLHGSERCGFKAVEYLNYFYETRESMKLTKDDDIKFLMQNRLDLLSYIDRLIRIKAISLD